MDASKKEIAEKLVNSNTLGLKEMAGTILSELEKNEKVKEVVVRVRVVRLPKQQQQQGQNSNKNKSNSSNAKQAKCRAKVSTLSYKFNVNQKNLHKLLLKRRQQLRSSSLKSSTTTTGTAGAAAINFHPATTHAAAAASTTIANSPGSSSISRKNINAFRLKTSAEMNNEPNVSNSSYAHMSFPTFSPLSTTAYSDFSSPRVASSSLSAGIMMYPEGSHENSPLSASVAHDGNLLALGTGNDNVGADTDMFEFPSPNPLVHGEQRFGSSSGSPFTETNHEMMMIPSATMMWPPNQHNVYTTTNSSRMTSSSNAYNDMNMNLDNHQTVLLNNSNNYIRPPNSYPAYYTAAPSNEPQWKMKHNPDNSH